MKLLQKCYELHSYKVHGNKRESLVIVDLLIVLQSFAKSFKQLVVPAMFSSQPKKLGKVGVSLIVEFLEDLPFFFIHLFLFIHLANSLFFFIIQQTYLVDFAEPSFGDLFPNREPIFKSDLSLRFSFKYQLAVVFFLSRNLWRWETEQFGHCGYLLESCNIISWWCDNHTPVIIFVFFHLY